MPFGYHEHETIHKLLQAIVTSKDPPFTVDDKKEPSILKRVGNVM